MCRLTTGMTYDGNSVPILDNRSGATCTLGRGGCLYWGFELNSLRTPSALILFLLLSRSTLGRWRAMVKHGQRANIPRRLQEVFGQPLELRKNAPFSTRILRTTPHS